MIAAVLVRFAHLTASYAFTALWLWRLTDREKDVEILAPDQVGTGQRSLGWAQPAIRRPEPGAGPVYRTSTC
jgi:hypothetical protein